MFDRYFVLTQKLLILRRHGQGVSQKNPCRRKNRQTLLSGEAGHPIKYLGFFGDFFGKISGILGNFGNFRFLELDLTKLRINLVKFALI